MKVQVLVPALLACLAACSAERLTAAQFGDNPFLTEGFSVDDAAVGEEVRQLPFKHVEWEYTLTDRKISRMTLGSSHLFLETPDFHIIAMDRFTGKIDWIHKIATETPLDWPPVAAFGVAEELRRLEDDVRAVARKVQDVTKEKGAGVETQRLQKKRMEIRERLRVAAFGDNVYFISRQVLYCVDRLTGMLKWTRKLPFIPSAAPYAIRNYVFIPGADLPRVWVLDVAMKGADVSFFRADLDSPENHIMNRAVFSDPSLYFVSHDGNVYCYRVQDGSLTWKYATERPLRADPCVYPYRETTVDERGKKKESAIRLLLVGGTDYAFYAIDGDAGSLLWKYECGGEVLSRAVAVGKTVYVKTEDGALLALEVLPMHVDGKTGAAAGAKRNGNLRWKLPLGERFLVKGKDRVYVLGAHDEIFAIDEMSGDILGRYPTQYLKHLMTNADDEFFYAASPAGHVYCLKESKTEY